MRRQEFAGEDSLAAGSGDGLEDLPPERQYLWSDRVEPLL